MAGAKYNYDLVIVGGGIAGLSMACALVHEFKSNQQTLPRFALLDAGSLAPQTPSMEKDLDQFDPRVSALTQYSCEFLRDLRVWENLQAFRFADFDSMTVWDGEGTAKIDFDSDPFEMRVSPMPVRLGSVVENRLLVYALVQYLLKSKSVDLIDGVKVEKFITGDSQSSASHLIGKNGAELILDNGDLLRAGLVIAADGARSTVREAAGFETREWDYGHDAIVCTVETEKPHQNTAWQCFTKHGPLAFLPLAVSGEHKVSSHVSSIVWSQTRNISKDLMSLDLEYFVAHLEREFEHRLGSIKACSQRFSFPLYQRHAIDYVSNSVVLLGDAAHSIHPLAGQGINLGIKDAECLAKLLAKDASRNKPLGTMRSLGRYSRERKTDNLAMMALMEGFKRLFSPLPPPVVAIRNQGMALTDKQRWLKRRIIRYAMGMS